MFHVTNCRTKEFFGDRVVCTVRTVINRLDRMLVSSRRVFKYLDVFRFNVADGGCDRYRGGFLRVE